MKAPLPSSPEAHKLREAIRDPSDEQQAIIVEALANDPRIRQYLDALSPDDIRDELRPYGWQESDLLDDELNRQRILWLAAGQIVDTLADEGAGG